MLVRYAVRICGTDFVWYGTRYGLCGTGFLVRYGYGFSVRIIRTSTDFSNRYGFSESVKSISKYSCPKINHDFLALKIFSTNTHAHQLRIIAYARLDFKNSRIEIFQNQIKKFSLVYRKWLVFTNVIDVKES